MSTTGGWRIARVAGVDIRIDPSWTVIFFLVAYTFFFILEDEFTDSSTGALITLAILTSVIFFVSVLVHELAHSMVAKAKGIEVKGITLFLFGGATHADLDTESPGDEFQIAVVGPLTSVALAAVLWAIVEGGGGLLSDRVEFILGRLGWINLALGVFNLVPGFPLDGGRLLRSVVWKRTGNLVRATRVASQAGKTVGYGLIGLGILNVLAGGLVGGLWFVAVGWFLNRAAENSFTQLRVRRLLSDVEARRVMSTGLTHMPAETTLRVAVDEYFMRHDFNAFPVDHAGRTVGILTLQAVREVPRERWDDTTAADAMEDLSDACTASPEEPMDGVLERLNESDVRRILVIDGDDVTGVITPRDVARWLQRAQELGIDDGSDLQRIG